MIDLKTAILEKTDGGKDIFKELYPESCTIFANDGHGKLKLRNERTASASFRLSKDKNGTDCWMLKDFGADTDWTCFDAYMHEKGIKHFGQAVRILAEKYNIEWGLNPDVNKAKIECRPSKKDEESGIYPGNRRTPTEDECKVMGPLVTPKLMERYNYMILESYTVVKYDEKKKMNLTTTITATPDYPIFIHDCSYDITSKDEKGKEKKNHFEFAKIYKPLENDKAFRFLYIGTKPKDYINGLTEAQNTIKQIIKVCTNDEHFDRYTADQMGLSRNEKLKKVIICSGERDAMCVASLGYMPIWFNSETAKVNSDVIQNIYKVAETIYNIPDKDETGVKQGRKLALDHIGIYTIELPDWLSRFHDARKSPCKDFRDYVGILGKEARNDFKQLIEGAQCAKFWDWSEDDGKKKVEIHTMALLHFLKLNGFYKYKDSITKEIYPIRIQGYTVERYEPVQIRDFVRQSLKELQVSNVIMEAYVNSKKASKQIYDDLDTIDVDFNHSDAFGRTIFFNNKIVRVTRISDANGGIEEYSEPKNKKLVWKEKINPHDFKKLAPAFTYNWGTGDLKIHLENNDSAVMRFIINTCRTYWRREMEDPWEHVANEEEKRTNYFNNHRFTLEGEMLDPEYVQEQKLNMCSKIYTIGYLMSQYKIDSCAKAVWAMENRITNENESAGRSGKSLFFKCFQKLGLSELVTLDGRNKKTTDNAHFMERVSKTTDILLIDDAAKGFDFYTYYKMITGSVEINPKNETSFELAYEDAPNIAFTSNFPIPNKDNSTLARILFLSFSDYYHEKGIKGEYRESRSVRDDIGKDLFGYDYSEEEYNKDINFFINCLQFYQECRYLKIPPIQPPVENIIKRILREEIGDPFISWADEFFGDGTGHVDECVVKQFAYDDYCKNISDRKYMKSPQSFKAALINYVDFRDDIFLKINPEDHPFYRKDERLKKGRLTNTCMYAGINKSYELIYIQSREKANKPYSETIKTT